MGTRQINFRFSDETHAELDALAAHLGIANKTNIAALAIRRMARLELGAVAPPTVKLPKTERKGKKT